MYKNLSEITLGAKYKDVITGFEGICIAKSEHLTGCDRVHLEPSVNDNKFNGGIWVDITCLEFVDDGVSKTYGKELAEAKADQSVKPGGPATPAVR